MAWTPTPPASIPTPDQLLAQLAPEPGEGSTGYVSPDDIGEIVSGVLSMLYDLDARLVTLRDELSARIDANEGAIEAHAIDITDLQARVTVLEP